MQQRLMGHEPCHQSLHGIRLKFLGEGRFINSLVAIRLKGDRGTIAPQTIARWQPLRPPSADPLPAHIDLFNVSIIPSKHEPLDEHLDTFALSAPDGRIPAFTDPSLDGVLPSSTDDQGIELFPYFKVADLVGQAANRGAAKSGEIKQGRDGEMLSLQLASWHRVRV